MSIVTPDASRFVFRAGPYIPPLVPIGAQVRDEYYGNVTCAGVTDSPIPWPGFQRNRGRHQGLMPIFFDGLVRAAVEEDEAVVARAWGVTRYLVNLWKIKLAGGCTDCNVVFTSLAMMRLSPEYQSKYASHCDPVPAPAALRRLKQAYRKACVSRRDVVSVGGKEYAVAGVKYLFGCLGV